MPIPENGLRGRLARVLSGGRFGSNRTTPTLNLIPPSLEDARAATHASEHNALVADARSGAHAARERAARQQRVRQWEEEGQKKAKKKGEQLPRRNPNHDIAFLSAPPFWALANAPAAVCTVPPSDRGNSGSVRVPAYLYTFSD